jgi:hypothetical protein
VRDGRVDERSDGAAVHDARRLAEIGPVAHREPRSAGFDFQQSHAQQLRKGKLVEVVDDALPLGGDFLGRACGW